MTFNKVTLKSNNHKIKVFNANDIHLLDLIIYSYPADKQIEVKIIRQNAPKVQLS